LADSHPSLLFRSFRVFRQQKATGCAMGLQNPVRQMVKKHRCVLRVVHDALREIFQSLNGFEVIENEIKVGEE